MLLLLVAVSLGCLAFLSGLISCSKPAPVQDKILRLGNGAEPKGIDPHVVTGIPEAHIVGALFEGLVSLHPATLAPLPGVAESWAISEDLMTYTFRLRKNARWSNGEAVTADDFVYAWRRLIDPSTASEYVNQGSYIAGAEDIISGKSKDWSRFKALAPDSHTLVVTLKAPTPFFLSLLNHHSLYPVHRSTIERHGDRWTRPENFVGNGAFRIKSWEMNKPFEVERNPVYWDAATVMLDGIHFYPIEDLATEENMFRTGKIHATNSLQSERIEVWKGKQEYISHPLLGTYYYLVNTKHPVLRDSRIRKALALSIDRGAIVKLLNGGQLPAHNFTPPGIGGFSPSQRIQYDPPRARELLTAAGFAGGASFPKLDILYNTSVEHKKIAEVLQQMWKKELGIDVGLFNQEWKVYLDSRKKLEFDLGRAGWIGDYPDPNTFLDILITDGGNNHTGWSNEKYDELIRTASSLADPNERWKVFDRCEELIAEEMPVIPLYFYVRNFLKDPRVRGMEPNALEYFNYKFISID